ncbi:formate dehydrogenase accessory sulfurtransferase FdhD [Geomicrobium sp. JCM 19055]|uniref:formate dehydrogenase accessory sulfurtransferase FdhD n=1 Tax=Geomicrobium sp. JCM 19055 TaxID=1460649 RepID=UPI00045EDCB2|nr:formate dehydrogenase accessory sulfurtransferase FdhD [Geomicrobium sp. JCM 19055]GAK00496.1 formate dehydrogenase chain D [Geomicrobium sp. JCM 19055]
MTKEHVNHKVVRYSECGVETVEDKIVVERPVTIKVNGEELLTIVCSPQYIEDMVIGYLVSEGIVNKVEDIDSLRSDENSGFVHVRLRQELHPLSQQMQSKRYLTSCCGMSRQALIFASDAKTTKVMTSRNVTLNQFQCFELMNELQEHSSVFRETGGVHNAALATKHGIVIMRVDIGRHNALDKIYGHCLRNNISLEDKVLVFSGRLSSEIVLKAAKIGCEVVLSKSAPTDRAIQIAIEQQITMVGFIRKQSMNVYTCSERIYEDKS